MFSNKLLRSFGILLVIVLIVCVVICSGGTDGNNIIGDIFANSNKSINYTSSTGTTLSNSIYSLELNGTDLSFELTHLASGNVYYSGKRANDGDDGLNDQNGQIFSDGIVVSYLNQSGVEARFGFTNSRLNPIGTGPVENISIVGNSIVANINLRNIPLKFRLVVALTEFGVDISIPSSYIQDDNDRLLYISPYPAVESRFDINNGYIFIPDGSGAVIDMNIPTVATQPYSQRVYGLDYGTLGVDAALRAADVSPIADIGYPVYAIADNSQQTGVVSIIDSGAEYAEINAIAAGSDNNRYNSVHTKFFYRDKYKKYLDKKGTFKNAYTEKTYNYDANLKLIFLNDDVNIATVAKVYRKYLIDKYNLASKISNNEDIGLRLQYLMTENRTTMFGDGEVSMTSTQNVIDYTNSFISNGITNQQISLLGYQSGGLTNSNYSSFGYSNAVNAKKLTELNNLLNNNKSSLSFNYNYSLVDTWSRGFSSTDVAMTISNNTINTFNQLTYLNKKDVNALVMLTNSKSQAKMTLDKSQLSKIGNNLSLDINDFSKFLSSSHLTYTASRSQSIIDNTKLLSDKAYSYNMANPYEYMLAYTSNIINAYQSNSSLLIETSSVPFVSMVMSGLINMYTSPINLNYNSKTDILKMIDYNIYPSYLITSLSSIELLMTNSNYIISSQYDLWKDNIISTYNEVNSALKCVIGSQVISRNTLIKDVYETVYANGVRIVVNYSKMQYNYNGLIIDAFNYKVV